MGSARKESQINLIESGSSYKIYERGYAGSNTRQLWIYPYANSLSQDIPTPEVGVKGMGQTTHVCSDIW
jgi:hypothetical protein